MAAVRIRAAAGRRIVRRRRRARAGSVTRRRCDGHARGHGLLARVFLHARGRVSSPRILRGVRDLFHRGAAHRGTPGPSARGKRCRRRGAVAVVRACGLGPDRTGLSRPAAALCDAARTDAPDRLASDRGATRGPVLLCRVLRHRDSGGVVVNASQPRAAGNGGGDLCRVRHHGNGCPARRASCRPAIGTRRRCRSRADREPCAPAVPLIRTDCSHGALGARAAAGDHQRRFVHRKRIGGPAPRVGGRELRLLARSGELVAARGSGRRCGAVARRPDGPYARHLRRARVGASPVAFRRRPSSGRLGGRTLSRAHRSSVPAVCRHQSGMVRAAVAGIRNTRGADARGECGLACH